VKWGIFENEILKSNPTSNFGFFIEFLKKLPENLGKISQKISQNISKN
jgi:hypothetical protein